MKNRVFLLAFIAALAMVFNACNLSEKPVALPGDIDLAVEEVFAEDVMEDVFSETFDIVFDWSDYGIMKSDEDNDWPDCRVRTVERPEDKPWPRVVTLDFGDGCEDKRGNVRKGKIVITIDAPYREEGSTRVVEFVDYYINDNKIEGIKTITNLGREDGILVFGIEMEKAKIITEDGVTISWDASKTRAFIEGEETPARWDNVYLINGTATKVNKDGVTVTRTITDLVRARNCRFPLSGIVEISRDDDRPMAVIDYGEGECDKFASITLGEGEDAETWIVDLSKRGKKWKKENEDEGVEKDD